MAKSARERHLEDAVRGLIHTVEHDLRWKEQQPYRALVYRAMQRAYTALGLRVPPSWDDDHLKMSRKLFDGTGQEQKEVEQRILDTIARARGWGTS